LHYRRARLPCSVNRFMSSTLPHFLIRDPRLVEIADDWDHEELPDDDIELPEGTIVAPGGAPLPSLDRTPPLPDAPRSPWGDPAPSPPLAAGLSRSVPAVPSEPEDGSGEREDPDTWEDKEPIE